MTKPLPLHSLSALFPDITGDEFQSLVESIKADGLVDPIIEGRAAFVVGSRVRGELARGALTPQQRFGNWLACLLLRRCWGAVYSDLGPFRAIDRQALERLHMRERTFGWTVEMQIKAAEAGLAHAEVPVSYRPRIGKSKVSGTVSGTIKAGYKILSVIARAAWRIGQTEPAVR